MDSFCNTDARLFTRRCEAAEFHGGIFLKSFPTSPQVSDFDRLVDDLRRYVTENRARKAAANATLRAARGDPERQEQIAKSLSTLERRVKAMRPSVVLVTKSAAPSPAETVSKAFSTLAHDASLSPLQRGQLMIALGGVAENFAKAEHPMLGRIDDIQAKLDDVLASGHAGGAEPLIKEALAHIKRGRIEGADHARLSLLLSEIRHKIEETSSAAKD